MGANTARPRARPGFPACHLPVDPTPRKEPGHYRGRWSDIGTHWARYIESGSDQLPTDAAAWPKLAEDLEQITLTEPGARSYIDVKDLASVRLDIRGRGEYFGRHGSIEAFLKKTWAEAQASEPALREARGRLVGKGVVSGEITTRLLPTLTESFALTASVIFTAFLLVFRSPSARLMTMIPSLVRNSVRVHRHADRRHSTQHRHDSHRLDHTRGHRERPDIISSITITKGW